MQKIGFPEAVDAVVAHDTRYSRDGYIFLRDALDFTVKKRRKSKGSSARHAPAREHVSGNELIEGIREYALKEFGPMVVTVFAYWGIHRCEDFGEMVFNLIREGIFGKTETDSVADFKGGYDFHEAFVKPFLAETAETPTRTAPAQKRK